MTAEEGWAVYDLPLTEPAAAIGARRPAAFDLPALLRNEAWFCTLRWLAIGALAAAGAAGWALRSGGIPGVRLQAAWPLLPLAGALLVLNVCYLVYLRWVGAIPSNGAQATLARAGLWAQVVLDLATLTVVVHVFGSIGTFAPFMYLFHIVLACIFLSYAQSLVVMLVAMLLYAACLTLEGARLITTEPVLGFILDPVSLPLPLWFLGYGSVAFVSLAVWYLASRLSSALRRREAELVSSNRRLEAAIAERAGYMLRTTHQLKAPFAAIHANAQVLLGGYCGELPKEATAVIEQIGARAEMLSRGIRSMLQLANLRSVAQDAPAPSSVDLAALIGSCAANLRPIAAKRGIQLEEDLAPVAVRAVQDHALMVVENLLSNAVTYCMPGGHVKVTLRQKDDRVTMTVRDDGIGIPAEKLPRIFDEYYRTVEAARLNPASTGLGLAIVRQIAVADGIRVRVESACSRGTVFAVTFPASPQSVGKPG